MIGMTRRAVAAERRVIAGLRGDLLAERLVARQTARRTDRIATAGVAPDAVVDSFERRVIFRERSGRDGLRAGHHREHHDERECNDGRAGHRPNPR